MELLITPENHAHMTREGDPLFRAFNECMKANTSVNEWLDAQLMTRLGDWGSEYHHFLRSLGIEAETDNGWWSIDAVRAENLEFFVKYVTADPDCPWFERVSDAIEAVAKVSRACRVESKFRLASEVVEAMTEGGTKP